MSDQIAMPWHYDDDHAVIYDADGDEALVVFLAASDDDGKTDLFNRNAQLAALAPELAYALAMMVEATEQMAELEMFKDFGVEPDKGSRLGIAKAVLGKWKAIMKGDHAHE